MQAFHFSKNDCKMNYGDNRLLKTGRTYKVDCEPILCEQGLHASIKLLDALYYAPGSVLWLVEMRGKIVKGNDKIVATERKHIARFNAEKLLREFARKQALINIEKIKPYTDKYDLIIEWLETGDNSLQSAAEAAAKSAEDAAWSAESAAWSAAWSAEAAAWSAEAAARSAEAAARSAEAAARSAEAAARSAAEAAVRSAAEAAARSAANDMLTNMVRQETGWDI